MRFGELRAAGGVAFREMRRAVFYTRRHERIASVLNDLTARQCAMLQEMGIRPWWPEPRPVPPPIVRVSARPTRPNLRTAPPDRVPMHTVVPRPAPGIATPSPSFTPAPLPPGIDTMDWDALERAVADCRACELCTRRRQAVLGVGARRADWLIVGEAPGEREDALGEPFVGPSGRLLDAMLAAVGLRRHAEAPPDAQPLIAATRCNVYIANAIKCRPPENRNPRPEEMAACEAYLRRQIALIEPKLIVALGRFAVQTLLKSTEPLGKLRGRVYRYDDKIPIIVGYHPSYLLRAPTEKAKAWQDWCLALETLSNHNDSSG